jgi:hypothetical protein
MFIRQSLLYLERQLLPTCVFEILMLLMICLHSHHMQQYLSSNAIEIAKGRLGEGPSQYKKMAARVLLTVLALLFRITVPTLIQK